MGEAPLAIVLAAGLSTRMKSKTPKMLHSVAGRPLVTHILRTVRAVGARPLVVLSKESAAARELFDDGTRLAIQEVARGTGDALKVALAAANGDRGIAFIVYGDTPLLRPETLTRMRALVRQGDRAGARGRAAGRRRRPQARGRRARRGPREGAPRRRRHADRPPGGAHRGPCPGAAGRGAPRPPRRREARGAGRPAAPGHASG